jgi:hypothetical protein
MFDVTSYPGQDPRSCYWAILEPPLPYLSPPRRRTTSQSHACCPGLPRRDRHEVHPLPTSPLSLHGACWRGIVRQMRLPVHLISPLGGNLEVGGWCVL